MMTATVTPADASAKSLTSLSVVVDTGGFSFTRDVHPIGDTSLEEIMAAMKNDINLSGGDFINPFVDSGELYVVEGGKHIVLARYSTWDNDYWASGEITEVTAHFDDDSSEAVAL